MKLSNLVTSVGTGRLSETRFWVNVAKLVCTVAFVWKVYEGTDTWDIWLIYLGAVGGSALASKAIALKFSSGQPAVNQEPK
jgi:hypothetical protein